MTEPELDSGMQQTIDSINQIIDVARERERLKILAQIREIRNRSPLLGQVVLGALMKELQDSWEKGQA